VIAIPSHFESSGISGLFCQISGNSGIFPGISLYSIILFQNCRRPAKDRRFCPTRCPSRFLQMWCLNSLTTCQWIRWKTV